ncbi:phosphatidic acid phosphatase type 2/haloperoxidase [Xylariomycetidae sp. FL0641]|nr:phosphatidic acid phosphatase type 2/haloperoxidase [Xylariomycetidae sp. FL0641]
MFSCFCLRLLQSYCSTVLTRVRLSARCTCLLQSNIWLFQHYLPYPRPYEPTLDPAAIMGPSQEHAKALPAPGHPATAPDLEKQSKYEELMSRARHWWYTAEFEREQYSMDSRPTLLQWCLIHWADLLTFVLLGIICLGIYNRGAPIFTRTFPLTVGTSIGYQTVVSPAQAYEARPQIIHSALNGVMGVGIPLTVILLLQIRLRNFWDTNNAIFGLLYACLAATTFQVFIKWLVGGLRPNFYDVCRPKPSRALGGGVGYQNYMWTSDVCTAKHDRRLWNAMQSFPSGHATSITAGMLFLFLYLNAKLKVFANYNPSLWKLLVLYLPILVAVVCCGLLTIDHSHNWYDILAGAIIGAVFALSAYRMVYASIFDWRVNHIPLHRGRGRSWKRNQKGLNLPDLVVTRRADWRKHDIEADESVLPAPVTNHRHAGEVPQEQAGPSRPGPQRF